MTNVLRVALETDGEKDCSIVLMNNVMMQEKQKLKTYQLSGPI